MKWSLNPVNIWIFRTIKMTSCFPEKFRRERKFVGMLSDGIQETFRISEHSNEKRRGNKKERVNNCWKERKKDDKNRIFSLVHRKFPEVVSAFSILPICCIIILNDTANLEPENDPEKSEIVRVPLPLQLTELECWSLRIPETWISILASFGTPQWWLRRVDLNITIKRN